MGPVKITPLGAGQDVGRSCILVRLHGKAILFDCGMHMGYHDERRFPDFSKIAGPGSLDQVIDCVIITHFHLDHCGSLPFLTEKCGYSGPIYMTTPTKSICPLLLQDMCQIMERRNETAFNSNDVYNCMTKVTTISLDKTINCKNIEIRAFYAGHVLGAAMFSIKVDGTTVLYTGDYNMTPDRHLGAARIENIKVDVLITESTYATTIRDSKRARERDFLSKVHDCVRKGGKVLIPVFALGRAQELCVLIDGYWDRMNLSVPVYFSGGLMQTATEYYKIHKQWTSQSVKNATRNVFDYLHISPFDMKYVNNAGPMVVFASPGMLHVGASLDIFKRWCHDPNNMIILPGYCVYGTVGQKVLSGEKQVEIDQWTKVNVNMAVENLSFSAHVDAKGIVQMIQNTGARKVVLVHGDKSKMAYLKNRIIRDLRIPCYDPENNQTINIQ